MSLVPSIVFGGGSGGGGGSSASTLVSISKATDQSYNDALSVTSALNNLAGNDILMKLADGDHPFGTDLIKVGNPYNGALRIEADSVILTPGINQTSSITLDDDGYFSVLSDLDVYVESIKLIVNSASQQIPFVFSKQSVVVFNNCYFDFSAIQAEATIFSGGSKVILVGCVLEGSESQISNLGFDTDIELYNCSWINTRFSNGLTGYGTIAPFYSGDVVSNLLKSDSTGAVVSISEFQLDVFPVSGLTDTEAIVNARFSKRGTIYWGVYTDGSTEPTSAELISGSGTGFLIGGSVSVNAGDEFQLLTDAISTVIEGSTDYDLYLIAADTLNRNFSAMRFVEFTTTAGLTQLTAPTLNSVTVTSATSLTANWTDNNTSPNESSFTVGYQSTTWTDSPANTITGVSADSVSQLIESLTTDQAQFVRVIAIGDGVTTSDSAWSNEISATPADLVAPTLQSVTIEDASPTDIVMVFDEPVTGTNLGFTLSGTTETSFSSISGIGTNTITGVLATEAASGETILLNYDSGVGDMTDTATTPNELASISNFAVANNVGGASYITQYQTVYDAMTNKPSAAVATAQNAMVNSLVSGGYWSRMDLFYLFAQESNAAGEALLNWVSPGTHNAVEQGAGALVFTSLEGLTGDGVNYLTSYNPNTEGTNLVQDSATLALYSRTDGLLAQYDAGAVDGSAQLSLALRYSTGILFSRINTLTAQQIAAQPDSLGLFISTRTGATAAAVYQNGTLLDSNTDASTSVPNGELTIFARDGGNMSTRQLSLAFVMDGVDATAANAINTIIETYMDAIGAGVQA